MTFRTRTLLRLLLSLVAAVALTGLALSTVPAEAQASSTPLFVNTTERVYAVYPFQGRVEPIEMVGRPLNIRLSPDGAWLLVDVQPVLDSPARVFYAVDVATLAASALPLADDGSAVIGLPLWRWDGVAVLYTELSADGVVSAAEYNLSLGQKQTLVPEILQPDDGEGFGLPEVVWWTPEGFALLQYNRRLTASLLVYDADGYLSRLRIADGDAPPGALRLPPFSAIRLVDVGAGSPQVAVYRPGIDRWDVISPLDGTIERLAIGAVVADEPAGAAAPRYAITQQPGATPPLHTNIAVLEPVGRRPLFGDGQALVSVSPDGAYYTSGDFIGMAVSDGETRIPLDIPAIGTQLYQWQVVWAPLVSRHTLLGRYRVADRLLIIHTPTGDYNAAYTDSYRLAPDGESLVWVRAGVNNETVIERYTWSSGEETILYTTSPRDTAATLPVIVEYDGERVVLRDDDGLFSVTQDGGMERVLEAAPQDMILKDTVLSPDGTKIAAIRATRTSFYHTSIVIIDAATLTGEIVYTHADIGLLTPLVWRQDSRALLWAESNETIHGRRAMQYDLDTGYLTVMNDTHPSIGDAGMYSLSPFVWWTDEGYAVISYRLNGQVFLTGMRPGSDAEVRTQIGDYTMPESCLFDRVIPVVVDGEMLVGVHYPLDGSWRIINPLTGVAFWLADGQRFSMVRGVPEQTFLQPYTRKDSDEECQPGVFPEDGGS